MAETPTETSPTKTSGTSTLLSRMARTRFLTRAAIVFERLWPLVLLPLVAVSLYLSLSWLGVFRIAPDWLRIVLLAVFALAGLASLWPLRTFRAPAPAEIDRRIERANRLDHAPVSTQTDRITGEDAFATALWREHQARMARRLGRLSTDGPRPRVPERDPWGLRAVAALLLVTAFAFSLGPYGGSITDAFHAGIGRPGVPPRVDAWVTPPAYTGRPPVFLTSEANQGQTRFTVPVNSTISVRVTGGSGTEALAFVAPDGDETPISAEDGANAPDPEAAAVQAPATGASQFSGVLTRDGAVRLSRGGGDLQSWSFAVTPDKAPTISFAEDPGRAANGTLELAYEIEDDYGASQGKAAFALPEPDPQAHALYKAPDLPLTLPRRGGKSSAAKTTRDLTEHPWAGTPVELTLEATDDAGQTGRSETRTFTLPARTFTNPLAKALIEQRRMLALDANRKGRVMRLMDATMLWPEETFDSMADYLAIASAQSRLDMAGTDDQLRGVVDYLWDIALNIENGDLTDAEKRLKQAQQALKDALQRGAGEEEISALMKELRQAMQDYMREFAERAMQNPDMAQQPAPENSQTLSQRDLDRMLDQIEELAKSGARDQAEQLLSQLENMMNNLQAGRQQQGQGGQQSEMRQQMDQLGELMRRQQETMNETFGLNQQQRGQQQRGQPGQQPGQGQQGQPGRQGQPGQGQQGQQGQGQQGQGQNGQGGMSQDELAEALRQLQQGQGQLRSDLQGLMDGLEGLGIKPGEGFGEAGEAMGQAEGALGDADGERALGEQGRALESLRKGAQDMMNQMQQVMQGERGGGMEGGRQQNADRDPLGRPRATDGPDFGDSVDVPDEIDIQRARRILEAIRKRLGNALSPAVEKDYLERLLEMQ